MFQKKSPDIQERDLLIKNSETMTTPRQQIVVAVSTEVGFADFMIAPAGTHNRDVDRDRNAMERRVSNHTEQNKNSKIKYARGEFFQDVINDAEKSGITIPPLTVDEIKTALAAVDSK